MDVSVDCFILQNNPAHFDSVNVIRGKTYLILISHFFLMNNEISLLPNEKKNVYFLNFFRPDNTFILICTVLLGHIS